MNAAGRQKGPRVLIRGAGDFATGIIHRLHNSGFKVIATELEKPLAVRRGVALSEAVYENTSTVEGVTAVLATSGEIDRVLRDGKIPLVIDPAGTVLGRGFDIVVDARSAKRNLGTRIDDAPIVIAIGPGFEAGVDCHAVVETLPGEGVGRVIYKGSAAADTGRSGHREQTFPRTCACSFDDLEDLLFRAPVSGTFKAAKEIGSTVEAGDTVGWIDKPGHEKQAVTSGAKGMVRGIVRDGTPVERGMKLGDIDPIVERERCYTIGEKSRAVAGGVLEACMTLLAGKGMTGNRAAGSE